MASKWTLNTADMQEDFFADAALIGIASPVPAYRFCWMLNQHFDMDFVRDAEHDICMQTNKEQQHYFAVYQYSAPLNGPKYILYKLRNNKQNLLPEAKGLDFLWMVQSSCPDNHAEEIASLLRTMPEVQLAQMIAPEKLKHLNHLLV
jgi:hypothetical protein